MTRREQGFTLIELLAAMAILAVVSVMAVQALGGIFAQRDVLSRMDRDAATLARTLALLRTDLEGAVPVPLVDATGVAAPAITVTSAGFAVSRAGFGVENGVPGVGHVRWERDADGTLWRQVQVDPTSDAAPSPRVPMLTQVTEFAVAPLGGDLPTVQEPANLPPGLVVTLAHQRHGAMRIVVVR